MRKGCCDGVHVLRFDARSTIEENSTMRSSGLACTLQWFIGPGELEHGVSRMRKPIFTVAIVAGVVILLWIALANIHVFSPPRLVIKFNGKPASNVTLILPIDGGQVYQLDENGSINSRTSISESAILVPRPNGGALSVRFPSHGTKTVNCQGKMNTVSVVQYFGLVNNRYEQFTLMKSQVAEIESGNKTLVDIEEQIRRSD